MIFLNREFLYVDDPADACVFLMNNYNPFRQAQGRENEPINIGRFRHGRASVRGSAGRSDNQIWR
ncbi:MAG: hypothetical protein ACOCVY_00200 [Patescibacteria group bacterium]